VLDDVVDDGLVRTRLPGLGDEARLLLALARPRLTPPAQQRIHDFLAVSGADLDWGLFLDQACRHGVLPLAGRNLMRYRLVHSAEGRTLAPYRWIYSYAYEGNRRRNVALGDEYAKVVRGLYAAGLGYAIRKGPVLTEGVYHDLGSRRMGDLDVLLHPKSFPEFAAVANDLGYQQGHLSGNAEHVVAFDRETQLVWRVALANSTLPFLKPAQRDDVEVFVLDPCFSLFQPRSGITADVGDFLARAVETTAFGEPSRMLDPVDQVIDCCVQVHVEATTLMYIEMGKDLMVLKFLDLVELLRGLSGEARGTLSARVREYGLGQSAYYALHHAALLYPDDVPPDLVADFDPGDPEFLDTYGALDNHRQRWDRGFAQRLFDARRRRLLTAHSTVPGPRAVV
jgi:Uncharacterised nucleotidyltransferase